MNELGIECPAQNRGLAAACHLAGIIPIYGPVFSFLVWLRNRDSNSLLKFHAAQALLAQLLWTGALLLPLAGIIVQWIFSGLSVKLALCLQIINQFMLGALLVAAWIVFSYAAITVYRTGVYLYPVIGRTLAVQAGLIQPGESTRT